MGVLETAEARKAELEAQLKETPAYRELIRIKGFIAMHAELGGGDKVVVQDENTNIDRNGTRWTNKDVLKLKRIFMECVSEGRTPEYINERIAKETGRTTMAVISKRCELGLRAKGKH